jgi:Xaa-Pro aminopeptidase
MDNFEPPLLGVDSNVVAEVNMIVVIHPVLIAQGRRFSLGDIYLVTKTGAERRGQYPLELAVV